MRNENKIIQKFIAVFSVFLSVIFLMNCSDESEGSSNQNLPLNSGLIMIGDSYFALNGYVAAELENLSGERYRHYYINGSRMTGGSSDSIPNQYLEARSEDPEIRTVIMIGGGNDILDDSERSCFIDNEGSDCRLLIDSVFAVGQDLINTMNTDGVENVIYLFYPHLVGIYEVLNPSIDYAYTKLLVMTSPGLNFYPVDSRGAFAGHQEYFPLLDFHPNREGSIVLARLIWDVMIINGIEQQR